MILKYHFKNFTPLLVRRQGIMCGIPTTESNNVSVVGVIPFMNYTLNLNTNNGVKIYNEMLRVKQMTNSVQTRLPFEFFIN